MSKGKTRIVEDNTDKVLNATTEALVKAVLAGGFILETAVKISMSAGSHTGRAYKKKSGKFHIASAPGETPAVNTAVLVNSIKTHISESSATKATAFVGTNVEYAVPLEFGTSKMDKRPFMRPAFDENVSKIETTIKKIFKDAISGATS